LDTEIKLALLKFLCHVGLLYDEQCTKYNLSSFGFVHSVTEFVTRK